MYQVDIALQTHVVTHTEDQVPVMGVIHIHAQPETLEMETEDSMSTDRQNSSWNPCGTPEVMQTGGEGEPSRTTHCHLPAW